MPESTQRLSVDEKMAILIKAYELEPLPKLSLLIGERAVKELLHSGQYLGALLQPKNLYWITGHDKEVRLLDEDTARVIRDHPVTGYSHYISDHGAANVFGKQVFEGKMPLEPAIGAASAIGIVEQDREGRTHVLKKEQLGIKQKTIREVADKFYRVTPETPALLKRRGKEQYEYVHDEALRAKNEREAAKDAEGLMEEPEQDHDQWLEGADLDDELFFLRRDDDDLELINDQETPPLWGGNEKTLVKRKGKKEYSVPDMGYDQEPMDEDADESILPF